MSSEVDRTLWVGNLHEKVTEEILYELFLQVTPILSSAFNNANKIFILSAKHGVPLRTSSRQYISW